MYFVMQSRIRYIQPHAGSSASFQIGHGNTNLNACKGRQSPCPNPKSPKCVRRCADVLELPVEGFRTFVWLVSECFCRFAGQCCCSVCPVMRDIIPAVQLTV